MQHSTIGNPYNRPDPYQLSITDTLPTKDTSALPLFLSAEHMETLGFTKSTFYRLAHREDMPVVHIGKRLYLDRDKLLILLRNGLTIAFHMAKNANGSGSIKRREDGRWEGRLMIGFDPKTGKVRRKSVCGKTQKEARQKLTELAKQVDDGTYTEPLKMTLQQWLEVWLKEYNGNIKPYSYRTYSDRIRLHIVPALG